MPDLPDIEAHAPGAAHPVSVEVTRGNIVESRHRGSVAVVDIRGDLKIGWGDVKEPVFPRSAIKALQALAYVESGATDAIEATDEEISLMCASHGGEPRHASAAAGILARLGLSEADLECGPHWPSHEESARALAVSGETPSQLHNNCSGKHSGMLALAKRLGAPTKGYIGVTHPVQQRILGVLEAMTGCDLTGAPRDYDGCSVPTWAIPLENLAYAFARFGNPDDLPDARRDAALRIRKAVLAHPFMVAGTGRYCTEMMELLHGKVFLKTGAEGVFCAAVPAMGIGIALKCDDGATRGAEVMMTAVLEKIGVIGPDEADDAKRFLTVPVLNRNNLHTGDIKAIDRFLAF